MIRPVPATKTTSALAGIFNDRDWDITSLRETRCVLLPVLPTWSQSGTTTRPGDEALAYRRSLNFPLGGAWWLLGETPDRAAVSRPGRYSNPSIS